MMKTLQKYLLKEYILTFIPVLLFFILIFALSEFFWRLNDFITHKPHITTIIAYLILHIPLWFIQTLPLTTMLTTMFVVSHFMNTQELLTIKTLGVNTKKFFISLLLLGLILSIFSFVVQDKISARAFCKAHSIFNTKIKNLPAIDTNTINNLFYFSSKNDINIYITIQQYNQNENKVYSFLMEEYKNNNIALQIFSPIGKKQNLNLELYNCIIRHFNNNKLYNEKQIAKYIFALPVDINDFKYDFNTIQLDQFTLKELKHAVKISIHRGMQINRLLTEISYRYAISFLNFVLILLSIPLAQNVSSKYGKLTCLVYMIICVIIYWMLLSFFRTFGELGLMNPYISVWIPNLLFFFTGSILYLTKK